MANFFASQGDGERALEFLEESLALTKQIGDVQGIAATLHNMGRVIAYQRGEVEGAITLWLKSLALTEQIGDIQGRAATLAQMAWAATQQGKFEKARSFYLQAVQALAIVLAWSDVLKVL